MIQTPEEHVEERAADVAREALRELVDSKASSAARFLTIHENEVPIGFAVGPLHNLLNEMYSLGWAYQGTNMRFGQSVLVFRSR